MTIIKFLYQYASTKTYPMKLQITLSSADQQAPLKANTHPFEIIYATTLPGGVIGYYGPDVCNTQSVAVRFIPTSSHYLKKIGLWFMNNGVPDLPTIKVSLTNDKSIKENSMPGDKILEEWKFSVSAIGWRPLMEELNSAKSPFLEKDTSYWIVAEAEFPCHESGVWVMAGGNTGFSSVTNNGVWQPGIEAAVPATMVWGLPPVE